MKSINIGISTLFSTISILVYCIFSSASVLGNTGGESNNYKRAVAKAEFELLDELEKEATDIEDDLISEIDKSSLSFSKLEIYSLSEGLLKIIELTGKEFSDMDLPPSSTFMYSDGDTGVYLVL